MTDPGRRRPGLGRGLDALFGDAAPVRPGESETREAQTTPIERLVPNRFQPRRHFDPEALEGLVESIRAQGLLQPILVRPHADDPEQFEIVAGERRWRAAQRAQLHEVPILVRDVSDSDALQLALIENIQRQDLNPLEEAEAYHRLMVEFGHTQEALGQAVGKSRSHIANLIRLRDLPDPVKAQLGEGKLSAGHARALLSAADPVALAQRVVDETLTVRDVEALVRQESADLFLEHKPGKSGPRKAPKSAEGSHKDPNIAALEDSVISALGLKVRINETGRQSGTVTIHYATLDQLDDLLGRLGVEPSV